MSITLTLEGLHARLFGSYLPLGGVLGVWSRIGGATQLASLDLSAATLGWPMVVVGTMWSGALSGLWLRLRWGYRACLILGVLSLGYVGIGTLLASCVLLLLRSTSVRSWSGRGGASHDG